MPLGVSSSTVVPPPLDAPPPSVAYESAAAKVWHRLDTSFGMPYASASLAISVPQLSASATGSALTALYLSLAKESMKPMLSDATAAQLSIELAEGSTTIGLSAYGLSPKLPALLTASAHALVTPTLKPGRFAAHKQLLLDSLSNEANTPTPTAHARTLFSQLSLKHYYSPNATLTALGALQKADLVDFGVGLFNATYVEMLVMGNLDADGAVALGKEVEAGASRVALPLEARNLQLRANLAGGNYVYASKHPNPQETNGCVRLVMQLGKLEHADAAKATALGELVSQAFFYELRTVQQLGYIVQSAVTEDRGVSFLVFIVQSLTPPDTVTQRVHTFVDSIDGRLANTSATSFESVLSAAQQELLEPPKKLSSVADGAWGEILDRTFRFGQSKKVAAALANTTLADVRAFWQNRSALVGGGGRLLLQVYGAAQPLPGEQGVPQGYTAITSVDDFREHADYW